jgi:acyl-CoA reductase-like NAD-dependent aldehyde dehydrogenase
MSHIEISGIDVPALHFVDGNWIGSQTTFLVRSPLDWMRPLGELSLGTIDTGAHAIEAARRASSAWAAIGAEERAAHLHRLADTMLDMAGDVATVEAVDTGILLGESVGRLVPIAAQHIRDFAQMSLIHDASDPVTRRVASGVSLVLGTWRSPFLSVVREAAAALAAGNTVVIKAHEWSPLSAAMFGLTVEMAELPPGVVNVVQGVGEAIGDSLVTSTAIDRLTLMGSVAMSRNNAVMAARNLHDYRLELASKATFILLEDARIGEAARAAAAHFSIADPGSLAGVRVLAAREIAREAQETLIDELRSLRHGDSRHMETTSPPMIHQQPHTRLHALVDRCRSYGDDILVGGVPIDGPSLHFAPTLVKPISLQSEAVTEEVFGPVVTFEVFDADHGSVALANATHAPMIASIYTDTTERASAIAEELECSVVRLNHSPVSEAIAPVPGSSTAATMLDFHSRPKTLALPRSAVGGHRIDAETPVPEQVTADSTPDA